MPDEWDLYLFIYLSIYLFCLRARCAAVGRAANQERTARASFVLSDVYSSRGFMSQMS